MANRVRTPNYGTAARLFPPTLVEDTTDYGLVLLRTAILYVDAASAEVGSNTLVNLGTAGVSLDLQIGSTSGADTNDPLLLTHTGVDYLYLPTGSSVGCTAPATATGYKAYPLGGGAATTGAATGGAAFSFATAGSWLHIDLVDGSDVVVASFLPVDAFTPVYTDTLAVDWTITRPATGLKASVVKSPHFLFGPDDWIEHADTPALDFGASDDFTVVFAYRFWGTPSSDPGALIGKRFAPGQQNGWAISNGGGGSELQTVFQMQGDLGSHNVYSIARAAGDFNVSTGVRHATAATVDNYLADTPVTTTTSPTGDLSNDKKFVIGHSDWTGAGFQFEGEFYTAAVFDYALTAQEVIAVASYLYGRFDL